MDTKATVQLNSSEQQTSVENSNKNQNEMNSTVNLKKIFDDDNVPDSLFSQPTSSQRSPSIFDNENDIDLFGMRERTEEEEREFLIKTFGKDLLSQLEGKASTVHFYRTSRSRRGLSLFLSEEEPDENDEFDLALAELPLQTAANLSASSTQTSNSPTLSSSSDSLSPSNTNAAPSSDLLSSGPNSSDSSLPNEMTYEIDPIFARRSGSWKHKVRKAQNMSDKAWWNVIKQEVAKDDPSNRRATISLGHIRTSAPKDHTHDAPVKSRVEMWQQRLLQEQTSIEQEKVQRSASKEKSCSPRSHNEANVSSPPQPSTTATTTTAVSPLDTTQATTSTSTSSSTVTTTNVSGSSSSSPTIITTPATTTTPSTTVSTAQNITTTSTSNNSQLNSDLSSTVSSKPATAPSVPQRQTWRNSRPRVLQHSESLRLPAPHNPLQSSQPKSEEILIQKHEQQRQEQLRLLQTNQALLPGSRSSLNLSRLKGTPSPPKLPSRSAPDSLPPRPTAASVSLPPQPVAKKTETKTEKEVREYEYYLNLAKKMDFSDLQQYQMLYQAGVDFCNRPILVIIACKFPAKKMSIDRFLLYCISVMDPIVEKDYVIVYIHSGMTSENKLQFSWLKKVYSLFNRKYKKNLKQLFIVQPSFWVKMVFRLFRPFISSKFWKKLVYIEDIQAELSKFLNIHQLKLPEDVIQMTKKRSPKQIEEHQMFGRSLTEVMQHPLNKDRSVPIVLEKAIKYLEEKGTEVEGIFRLSGNAVRVREIKTQFDRGQDVDLSKETDPHVVAGLIKLFLRELPEPLFPFDFYTPLMEAWVPNDEATTVKNLIPILQRLPPVNRKILKLLVQLLAKIAANPATKMNTMNLSIVLAPNIIKCLNETPEQALSDTSKVNGVMKLIITHQDTLLRDEPVTPSSSSSPPSVSQPSTIPTSPSTPW